MQLLFRPVLLLLQISHAGSLKHTVYIYIYLAELLDHLLDADVSILRHLALHVGEPLAELLVLLVEHSPLI